MEEYREGGKRRQRGEIKRKKETEGVAWRVRRRRRRRTKDSRGTRGREKERERERGKVTWAMRYRETLAANAARRRGRRYRLASAFPRRRYLPAADVSFLSSSYPPLATLHHYPRLPSSHVLTSTPFILLRHPPILLSLSLSLSLSRLLAQPRNASNDNRVSLHRAQLPFHSSSFHAISIRLSSLPSLFRCHVRWSRPRPSPDNSPPPARSDYPLAIHTLLPPTPRDRHGCRTALSRWSISVCCPLSYAYPSTYPRLFAIRRGNRCCSGPELVQNRWARATSASRRGVGYPCRFTLLLSFLVPLLVLTPRSRAASYICTFIYIYIYVCARIYDKLITFVTLLYLITTQWPIKSEFVREQSHSIAI